MSTYRSNTRETFIAETASRVLVVGRGDVQQAQHAKDAVGTATALADLLGIVAPPVESDEVGPDLEALERARRVDLAHAEQAAAAREQFEAESAAALQRAGAAG